MQSAVDIDLSSFNWYVNYEAAEQGTDCLVIEKHLVQNWSLIYHASWPGDCLTRIKRSLIL